MEYLYVKGNKSFHGELITTSKLIPIDKVSIKIEAKSSSINQHDPETKHPESVADTRDLDTKIDKAILLETEEDYNQCKKIIESKEIGDLEGTFPVFSKVHDFGGRGFSG
jgi:hypothetical protein